MLCPFCSTARLNNEAPCPVCGAPSPLLQQTVSGYTDQPAQPSSEQPVQMQNSPISWLPVPYQQQAGTGQWGNWQAGQPGQPTAVIPFGQQQRESGERALTPGGTQNQDTRLPALADQSMEGVVYIPPMYTKPRPIIPRYRAISGLLSVLIVLILFCSGAGYYAQASGKIAALGQLAGIVRPANLKPTPTPPLPDPKTAPSYGPAANIINSASTASKIDAQTDIVLQPANVFHPGQTIYVTYSIQNPKKPGVVVIKWYMNGLLYNTSQTQPIKESSSGSAEMQFAKPAEGMVELYWNDQLAIRLYFVVR
ncbi:MAG TPA: hypothetical protein VKV40_08640 [Ktedonobacteraceae bacterium]|nr:hypothetical protein [Ktedonobacteraceae bacterium]